MADLKDFERWARRARSDAAPRPDVVGAVMRGISVPASLAGSAAAPSRPGTLGWFVFAAAAVAAFAMLAVGIEAWTTLQNPLSAWATEVGPWTGL